MQFLDLQLPTDECGFIKVTKDYMRELRLRTLRMGITRRGRGRPTCKGLCRQMLHVNGRQVSFKKLGLYYCNECSIAMKCNRCRCCGILGRLEPRQRLRLSDPHTKFIE